MGFCALNFASSERGECWPVFFESSRPLLRCHTDVTNNELKDLHKNLRYDQALIQISNNATGLHEGLQLFAQSDECYDCPCLNATLLKLNETLTCQAEVAFPLQFLVSQQNNASQEVCRLVFSFSALFSCFKPFTCRIYYTYFPFFQGEVHFD